MRLRSIGSMVCMLSAAAASAYAQSDLPSSRASIEAAVGVASGGRQTGVTFGGTATFAVSNRVSVEVDARWFDRGRAASGLSGTGVVLVDVTSQSGSRVRPYVAAGAGAYRASFDLDASRFLGSIDSTLAIGQQFCATFGRGMMAGETPVMSLRSCALAQRWGVGDLPDLYARRLGMLIVPPDRRWGTRHFTDPALVMGGGVRLDISRHVTVRPDARALIVIGDHRASVLGLFAVTAGYRF